MQAYDIVRQARQVNRVSAMDVIEALCQEFQELYGDRVTGDDRAMIAGIGLMDERPVTIIGIQKGRTTNENIERNFGASGPRGYRKAIRMMKQAEKFNRPVITLINTAGADASPESEDGGIGAAIAESLKTMSALKVPTLAIILGEGGSGGAIALALADEVWMLENSIYSILSPEAFASILWKNNQRAMEAAEEMKLTSHELLKLGVIERIIPEYDGKISLSNQDILKGLIPQIKEKIRELEMLSVETLLEKRHARFRKF